MKANLFNIDGSGGQRAQLIASGRAARQSGITGQPMAPGKRSRVSFQTGLDAFVELPNWLVYAR